MKGRLTLRRALLAPLVGLALAAVGLALVQPSHDREWKTDHARLPSVRFEGDLAHLTDLRDFRCSREAIEQVRWVDHSYDLSKLESLWYVVSIFDEPRRRGPAHGMLSFGFEGGDYLVISVEARKEEGEGYSPYLGLLKKYELIYVLGTEEDLVLTRAVYRDDDVYLYPIRTSPEKMRALLVDMLQEANEIRERPRFYNTLLANCTTQLAAHVNRIAPGKVPASWKLILPGYSDELVESLGLLDSDRSLEEVRRSFWINDRAKRFEHDPAFSRLIRSELP